MKTYLMNATAVFEDALPSTATLEVQAEGKAEARYQARVDMLKAVENDRRAVVAVVVADVRGSHRPGCQTVSVATARQTTTSYVRNVRHTLGMTADDAGF